MAFAYLSSVTLDGVSTHAQSVNLPSFSVTAGNLVIVATDAFDGVTSGGPSVTSVTDSAGNTWTLLNSEMRTNAANLYVYYSLITTTSTTDVITITYSSVDAHLSASIALQFSVPTGTLTIDVNKTQTDDGVSKTTITSPSFNTTHADELIVGFINCGSTSSNFTSTTLSNIIGASDDNIVGGSLIASTKLTGETVDFSFTTASTPCLVVSSFYAAAASTGSQPWTSPTPWRLTAH